MDRRTFKLIEDYMMSCMKDSAHDREHVYRVLYNALDIAASEENVDMDVLVSASLLHDIGRAEQLADPSLCHAEAGSKKAYDFLLSIGFSEAFAIQVRDCVITHRFRKSRPPESLEAKILFDADKLDAAGAVGIARTLIYKGTVGEPIYSLTSDGKVSDGSGDEPPSFFREYKMKLEKIYSGFYTEKGRQLAKERRDAAISFYESLYHEVSASRERGRSMLERML